MRLVNAFLIFARAKRFFGGHLLEELPASSKYKVAVFPALRKRTARERLVYQCAVVFRRGKI